MAVTKTINGTVSQNAGRYTYQLYCEEQNVDQANNTSKLKVTVKIITGGSSGVTYASRSASATHTVTINGTNYSFTTGAYDLVGQTTTTLGSVTSSAIQHGTDGTKTVSVSASSPDLAQGGGYGPYSGSASGSVTLTTIPRGFTNTPTLSPSNLQETSLNVTWGTSENASKIEVYLDGTLVQTISNLNAKSGTFTVTGTAGTGPHTLYYKATRKDTGIPTDSESYVGWSFYDYPKVKDNGIGSQSLTIGSSQTLTLYNPLHRNVTVKMYKNNTSGTELYSGTTNGEAITFTPNASTLYNSIPNDREGTCVYSVVYGSSTKTTGTATYKIKGNENPTFSESGVSYTANKTSLTNNNQVVIDKYATITVSIDTPATSSYGSTIDKYVIKWGNATATLSSGTTKTITGGSGNKIVITVYDKRQMFKEVQKTITNVPYTDITINNDISASRTNGVEAEVKLSFRGTFYNAKFGTDGVQNAIYHAKYYVSTDGSTWSNAFPSGNALKNAITVNGNNFSVSNFNIHADGSSGGFTIGTQYYVKVEIKDDSGSLSTATAIAIVTDGKIARDVYKDSSGNYHEGLNGLADSNYALKVHGKVNATEFVGNLNGNASTATTAETAETADTATKLGSSTVGGTNRPIYLNSGSPAQCNTPASGNWFRGVPFVGSGGVIEIGRYIDFHPTNASTADYTKRIDAGTGTTARTITIPDESGTIQCKPKNLYNNDTGTTGTITLSETSANFAYLKITYYKDESGAGGRIYNTFTISVPNGKLVSLFDIHYANASTHQFVSKIIQISGTSITHKYGMLTNIGTNKTVQACEVQNPIYITRVDGYR